MIFAVCLAALMLSFDGWGTLKLSAGDTRTRSYFGVYTVRERADGPARTLTHGTTLHGIQSLRPGQEWEPTSYYGRRSGVGIAMDQAERLFGPGAHIGVVGLGTGTLACYKRPGQSWSFFEIDPRVVDISRRSGRFTFLSHCAPDARVILGDARLKLGEQAPGQLHLLAVDAFSSDAVPMHLLTREAMEVYGRAMRPEGLLLIHISNRYMDLRPVLASGAKAGGWRGAIFEHYVDPEVQGGHLSSSVWVALSRDQRSLERLKAQSGGDKGNWEPLVETRGFPGWSDDFASILPLLKGWPFDED